ERLKLIRLGQSSGLSLKDVQKLLVLLSPGQTRSPCDDIQHVLEGRLSEITRQLKELRGMKRAIELSLKACCNGSRATLCETIIRMNNGKPILRDCDDDSDSVLDLA